MADHVIVIPAEVQVAFWAAVLSGLGMIGVYLRNLQQDLVENTKVTKQVETQTNGQLANKEREIIELRQKVQSLQLQTEMLADIVRYIKAQPEAKALLDRYRERRIAHITTDPIQEILDA